MNSTESERGGSISTTWAEKSPPDKDEPRGDVRAYLAELRAELAGVVETLEAVTHFLRAMGDKQREISGQLRRVQSGLEEVTALAPLVRKHETDIVQRLAHRTSERQDIGSERYRDQQAVWKRFDVITSRPVTQAVYDILQRDERVNERGAKPELVGQVVRLLFPTGPEGDPEAIDAGELGEVIGRERFDALLRTADEVRQAAAELGMVAYWGPVDQHTDWFVDWPSSGPTGAAVVVLPAWAAEGRLVGPGKVFRA
jgi:hypothetical protein